MNAPTNKNSHQIYARNRILLGDCVERMKHLPTNSIDMVLTDPPYLVNYKDRSGRVIANDIFGHWLEPAFNQMYRILKPNSYCVVFYGWSSVDQFMSAWKKSGFKVLGHLVFQKNYASGQRYLQYKHECAYLLAKGHPKLPDKPLPSILPWKYTGNKLHPTQKPVETLRLLVESFSSPHDIVLDPFVGSGSTAVASLLAHRDYLGFELDKNHHATAVRRLNYLAEKINIAV